jgi:hypothetical protein
LREMIRRYTVFRTQLQSSTAEIFKYASCPPRWPIPSFENRGLHGEGGCVLLEVNISGLNPPPGGLDEHIPQLFCVFIYDKNFYFSNIFI